MIERLPNLQKLSEIGLSNLGSFINAWVTKASVFNEPFVVYKDFIVHITIHEAIWIAKVITSNWIPNVYNQLSRSFLISLKKYDTMICFLLPYICCYKFLQFSNYNYYFGHHLGLNNQYFGS